MPPKQNWQTASDVSHIQQALKGVDVGLTLLIDDQHGSAPISAECLEHFVMLLKKTINTSLDQLDQVRAEIMEAQHE